MGTAWSWRTLVVAGAVLALFSLGVESSNAASISLEPTMTWRAIDEADPTVTFSVMLNMAGETSGVAFADVFISLSNPALYQAGTLVGAVYPGDSPFAYLSWDVLGDQVSLQATSEVFTPVPTPTGAEVFHLGDIIFEHAGQLGTLLMLLDLDATSIGTLGPPPDYPYIQYTLDNLASPVGTLELVAGATAPEPASALLVLVGLAGIAGLRRRSRG